MAMTKIQEKQNKELRLVSAMVKFQALKLRAKQSGVNKFYGSKYSTLEDVVDVANQATQFGICFTQHEVNIDGKEYIRTVLRHENDTDTLDSCTPVPCVNINVAHNFGSGLTYAKRYGLQTLFGIPSEDDDGNGAVEPPTMNPQVQNEINKNNIM
jgi:tRNA U34 2-thiouridine synthase MnmA/TrmU